MGAEQIVGGGARALPVVGIPRPFLDSQSRPVSVSVGYAEQRAADLRHEGERLKEDHDFAARAWLALTDLRYDDEAAYALARAAVETRVNFYRAHPDPLWTVAHEAQAVLSAIEDAKKKTAPKPAPAAPKPLDPDAAWRCRQCGRHHDCSCGT